MADNAQKLFIGDTLNQLIQRKIDDAIQQLGAALPCSVVSVSGAIVTVNFLVNATPFTLPNVQVPIFGPEYIRYPIQAGCLGVVFPCSVFIGNVSGIGSSNPDFTRPGNLSSLVFFPIGNKNWSATDDTNAVVIYGPDGVILRTVDKKSVVTVGSSGTTIKVPIGDSLVIDTLPTAPPSAPGSLWNSGGTVMVV